MSKYVAGPDIDLDVEIETVTDKTGRRIAEVRAGQIAADRLAKASVGRH